MIGMIQRTKILALTFKFLAFNFHSSDIKQLFPSYTYTKILLHRYTDLSKNLPYSVLLVSQSECLVSGNFSDARKAREYLYPTKSNSSPGYQ